VERRDGLKCGFCGEERWAEVWVLWRGEMSCSQCRCCGEERWAAVSVGSVERRDGLHCGCCGEISPPHPAIGPHITCFPAHRLFKYRQKSIYFLCSRVLMFLKLSVLRVSFITSHDWVQWIGVRPCCWCYAFCFWQSLGVSFIEWVWLLLFIIQ